MLPGDRRGLNMRIQWGHGLFRVWLVTSVIWVALSGWIQMQPEQGRVPTWGETKPVPPFDPRKPYEEVRSDGTIKLNKPKNPFDQFDQTAPAFDENAPIVPISSSPIETRVRMAATIIGPPIFLLIFGLSFWWVIQGFKPQEK
jgi:hypothetical protein